MKNVIQLTKVILFTFVSVMVFTVMSKAQTAQAQQGIQGHEAIRATVNFADLVAYDAAHPEIRANQQSPKEVEFNHGDIIERMHGNNVPQNTHQMKSSHHEKFILPASPAPVTTFDGEDDNTGVEPPDVSGAVGPVYVVTTHNQDVKISTKSGATVSTVALTTFWSPIGATISSDPKIVYDPSADRFIFVCLVNYQSAAPLVGVAVTATNDPTGTWYQFAVDVDSTGASFLDYPELGYNKNWVTVGGNYFNNTSQNFTGVGLFVIDKPKLYNNTGLTYTKFTGAPYFDPATDFCITGTSIADTTVNDLFILESYDGTQGIFRQFVVSGTPTNPVLTGPQTIQTSFLWNGSVGANIGPQLGTTTPIDLDDDRITGSVVYRNGHIWVTHMAYLPIANPTRSSAHWMELDTMGNIIQDAMIDDPTSVVSYGYPAIAVGSNENAIIAYTNLSSTYYPSCGYSFRAATDPINTFRGLYQYKAGGNTYSGGRWGDYSFACVDPVNDSTFWVVAEYAEAAVDTWGSWWAEVNPVCLSPYTPVAITGPSFLCASSLNASYYSVAAVAGATSYTWTVNGTGWTSIASTTDSILVTPGTGTGTITCSATNACGTNAAQVLTVQVSTGPPTNLGAIAGNLNVCDGTPQTYSVTLDTTVSGYSWVLPNSWSGSSTSNVISTTAGSQSGTIMVDATNACGTSTWDSIVVNLPAAPTAASPDTVSCGQTATLTATGNATIEWYNQQTGGNPIFTGNTLVTPPITFTTTYYVENDVPGTGDYDTPNDNTFGAGGNNTFPHYEIFNVMSPCTLVSVVAYAGSAGPRTISLFDGSGNQMDTLTVNMTNGQNLITLNFNLPVGNNYQLGCVTGTQNLYRNSAGSNYPYNDANGFISITGNDVPDPARFYFFYHWQLLGASCGSARLPVEVVVVNGVQSAFSFTNAGNAYNFTDNSLGNVTSWSWNFGDGNTSTSQSPSHTYAGNGTYTVTLIVSNGAGCNDTSTQIVYISTGIYSVAANASLDVYPNPVNDNLIVNLSTVEFGKEWTINVSDIIGQVLLTKAFKTVSGSNQTELNFSSFAKGIYLLELENNGTKLIRKVVKE